jgi:hypothetical protein
MPPEQRTPHFLEEMVRTLGYSPSPEVEGVLFKLAAEDPRFYLNHEWFMTALRFGTPSSALRIIDLVVAGVFDRTMGDWHLARELGNLVATNPEVRERVYRLLETYPVKGGLVMLARAVAECPDEEGLLLLVELEREQEFGFLGWQTVERVITEHVPSEDWAGAYDIVPVPAVGLRKRLFSFTTDGGPADLAARCLRLIDEYRDKFGNPDSEPRHPDLASGKRWPILQPASD